MVVEKNTITILKEPYNFSHLLDIKLRAANG